MEKLLKDFEKLNKGLLLPGNWQFYYELQKQPTFDEQLAKFMKMSQPNEEDLNWAKEKVRSDIHKTLNVQFPRGKAFFFGSSVSGLALITSDLDIFFDSSGYFNENNKVQLPAMENTSSTSKETFEQALKLLNQHPKIFQGIFPISYAKIPVIKFHHRPTRTECDISFKQGFGVYNNQLVKFCLTLDSRIKPLTIVIKCWTQERDLYGRRKISNYPLVMLIFFYLQQPEIQLVPHMKDLRKGEKINYRGWNVNFNEKFPSTTSNCGKTIPELLKGFFQFYSNFEFSKNIIRPWDGTALAKDKVRKDRSLELLFPELEKFAWLQDPIELDRNVIVGWSQELTERFQIDCKKTAAKILELEDKLVLPKLFKPV